MQEKEMLMPRGICVRPPQAVEAKGQGWNSFTESKGWKTKSWGCACAVSSNSRIPPTTGSMQIQQWKLRSRNGKLLGGGPEIGIHAHIHPGLHVYLSSLRIQKLTLPWGFSAVLRSTEVHTSPSPVFFLAASFSTLSWRVFLKNWEFFTTQFIFCPSAWLLSGSSDLDHTHMCTLPALRMEEPGHLQQSHRSLTVLRCVVPLRRKTMAASGLEKKFRKLLCECSWGKKHWRYLIYK